MALYRLRRPLTDKETTYLEGSYPWHIPYLACHLCGRKTGLEGVSYPSVDLSLLPNPQTYLGENRHNAQTPEVIAKMTTEVRSLLAADLWIPPRTSFGQFSGYVEEATKRLYDFAWAYSNPFVTEAALHSLEQAGIRGLRAFPATIIYLERFNPTSRYLELEVQHEVALADPLQPWFGDARRRFRCEMCGFDNGVLPDPLRIRCDTIPADTHIMRCREYPICKIVSEELALTIMRLTLTGVRVEMVEVV